MKNKGHNTNMDIVAIEQTLYQTLYFASGIIASIIGGYGYMKTQNKALYPIEKIEAAKARIENLLGENEKGNATIKALTTESEAYQALKGVVGNISEDELKSIIETAKGYADKGAVSVAEAQKLGVMIIEAVETKE